MFGKQRGDGRASRREQNEEQPEGGTETGKVETRDYHDHKGREREHEDEREVDEDIEGAPAGTDRRHLR